MEGTDQPDEDIQVDTDGRGGGDQRVQLQLDQGIDRRGGIGRDGETGHGKDCAQCQGGVGILRGDQTWKEEKLFEENYLFYNVVKLFRCLYKDFSIHQFIFFIIFLSKLFHCSYNNYNNTKGEELHWYVNFKATPGKRYRENVAASVISLCSFHFWKLISCESIENLTPFDNDPGFSSSAT